MADLCARTKRLVCLLYSTVLRCRSDATTLCAKRCCCRFVRSVSEPLGPALSSHACRLRGYTLHQFFANSLDFPNLRSHALCSSASHARRSPQVLLVTVPILMRLRRRATRLPYKYCPDIRLKKAVETKGSMKRIFATDF